MTISRAIAGRWKLTGAASADGHDDTFTACFPLSVPTVRRVAREFGFALVNDTGFSPAPPTHS